ncbi:MAG: branched-chain amino acid ABC transporter permease [Pseudonocardiaceae bacterium]|nr:branched-chain amino acid ABC transporter permease [Pseudonocardiaceae bacterium]
MRSMWRTEADLLGDVLALAAAITLVGASFGALAVTAGLPVWLAMAMSLLVFAGGSQFLVVGVLAAGGSPLAGLVGGLLVNARHLPFGLAIADVIGCGPVRWLGAHLLIDESTAFARAQDEPHRARLAFWSSGIALFVGWNVGTLVGAIAAGRIGEPEAFGIDAAFPAALLALLLPGLRGAADRRVAAGAAAIALLATPLLPAGLPVLAALAALGLGRESAS